MAHLDIKLENLMLDEKFQLQLIDFDLSYGPNDGDKLAGKGTKDFRSPELAAGKLGINVQKADIFSAGVILFVMFCGGLLPFKEEKGGQNGLYDNFRASREAFWMIHGKVQKKSQDFWPEEFKKLFNSMCHPNPKLRASL
mmetsp:Transcript_30297/g.27588  ORF Transcript_30297/g.27588 Transcript_30297/m.27588 type:complete len:140 (+) Transcript_30297:126-545(+)